MYIYFSHFPPFFLFLNALQAQKSALYFVYLESGIFYWFGAALYITDFQILNSSYFYRPLSSVFLRPPSYLS